MSKNNTQLLFGFFTLFAFVSIGVFGLLQFNHVSHSEEVPMTNCPYTQNGYSVCENGIDHVNDWRQFSNVIFSTLSIFSFLILGIVLYFFNKQNFLNQKQYFYSWKYYLYNKKLYTSPNRIIKWLSLLENSPAVSCIRHN